MTRSGRCTEYELATVDRPNIQWTRLALEGAAIVVSILLAFAIDAWWDDREDRAAERSAARRLVVEFSENLRQLEGNRKSHSESLAATRQLLDMTGPDQDGATVFADVAPLLISCLTNATFDPRLGTLDSLISSGRLHLIEDEQLQSMLTEWPSAIQNMIEWERIERENTEQLLLPFTYDYVAYPDLMAELALDDIGRTGLDNVSVKLEYNRKPSMFDSDLNALFGSLRFEGMLNNRLVNLQSLVERAAKLEVTTEEIIDRLSTQYE